MFNLVKNKQCCTHKHIVRAQKQWSNAEWSLCMLHSQCPCLPADRPAFLMDFIERKPSITGKQQHRQWTDIGFLLLEAVFSSCRRTQVSAPSFIHSFLLQAGHSYDDNRLDQLESVSPTDFGGGGVGRERRGVVCCFPPDWSSISSFVLEMMIELTCKCGSRSPS